MEEGIYKNVMFSWEPVSPPDLFCGAGMRVPSMLSSLSSSPLKEFKTGICLEVPPESIQSTDGFCLSWRYGFQLTQ